MCKAQPTFVLCYLFAIARGDGSGLRLIYDGRPLNANCRRPPHLVLRNLREELKQLFSFANGTHAVSLDFSTWFVQLCPRECMRRFFGCAHNKQHGLHYVTGLPMGWAWAPILAQLASRAVVRAPPTFGVRKALV